MVDLQGVLRAAAVDESQRVVLAQGGGARCDGSANLREQLDLGPQLLTKRAAEQLAHEETLSDSVGGAGEALALQLGDEAFQPVLNRDRVAAEGSAMGAVERPFFGERVLGVSGSRGRWATSGRWGGRRGSALDAGERALGGREKRRVAGGGDEGNALVRRELLVLSSGQERHQQFQGDLGCRVGDHSVRAADGTDALLKKSKDGNSAHL